MTPKHLWRILLPLALLLTACGAPPTTTADTAPEARAAADPGADSPRLDYAIAIHGGAGVIPKDMEEERVAEYRSALERALSLGRDLLAEGAPALDVVERVVRQLEDEPLFNAGKGAVFTNEGNNELDAAIMDGRDRSCGAVAGVTRVRNPITLARKVMENSPHVFLIGRGAEVFAGEQGLEFVDPEYFYVERRYQQWQRVLLEEGEKEKKHGTVGAVALDRDGNLAAATSTGGTTNKRFGRVGDVPIIGAGTFADNASAAISCTGFGEQFIRHNVAHDVAARMTYGGRSLEEAAKEVVHGILEPEDGGLIAVGRDGSIALVFNSAGMFRGAADAEGRFEVAIWEE